ncbi:hypothetical protein H072_10428 [Dactylellina haptotyla CBS 200.50]|uniref:LCCL domain-containing protein n=1 Tax=Dactylellina haptotyla (strain CBS 200.50) TaxID=1284197 RepID=S8A053_DACHA|nr:hypothetical protein H072_10428 [Dactylellina haptotyla CBS 200.50]
MTGYARDENASAADLESGSQPYSRSDSPSPERPLLDSGDRTRSGHRNARRGSRNGRRRNSDRYSDDIERLDGDGQRSRYHYSSTSLRIPKKYTNAVAKWVKGPSPPEKLRIRPILPDLQAIPLRILDNLFPTKKSKIFAWAIAAGLWIASFIIVVHFSYFRREEIILGCNDTLWMKNAGCGLDGINCRSFANESFTFRCPQDCNSARLLEPYTVGDRQFNYQSLLIGGGLPSQGIEPDTRHYRADSFICLAAVHSGVLEPNAGGCARLRKTGMQASFPASSSSGIQSVEFDAPFVSSFTIEPLDGSKPCTDLRWTVFGITLAFNIVVSLFTANPTVFFWSLFCSIFWEVGMVGDPPDHSFPYDLVAITATRFLPTAFAAYVLERMIVRRTLQDLNAQLEKTVLWVGACWFGALNNYTFDKWIPISRLTPHDLEQQPGAKAALAIIVIVLVGIAVFQAWSIRKEGNMGKYLAFYGFVAVCIGLMLAIPKLNLRIHHYVLALLLLPGTRIQTRPSLVYQGLLMGLFINGLARWGWDGVLQTSTELRGDALLGSILPKVEDVVVLGTNVTISWAALEAPWDSVSVLVNDVERYRGNGNGVTLQRVTVGEVMQQSWWDSGAAGNTTDLQDENKISGDLFKDPEREKMYIRLGYVSGRSVGDYTKAGTVFSNGTWAAMDSGSS